MDRTDKATVPDGPMLRAVTTALDALDHSPRDTGAVALARRYAELIDAAAPAAKYREPLDGLRALVDAYQDPRGSRYLDKIADALAAHSVASDLGPKLLAVLTALGMTAAGRGIPIGGGQGVPAAPTAPADPLDEFTARRLGQHGS